MAHLKVTMHNATRDTSTQARVGLISVSSCMSVAETMARLLFKSDKDIKGNKKKIPNG